MTVNLKSASSLSTTRLVQANPGPLIVPQVISGLYTLNTGGSLASTTTYWLRVTASNALGEGMPSPEFSYYIGGTGTNTNQAQYSVLIYPGTNAVKVYRGTTTLGEALIGSITGITWSAAQLAVGYQVVVYADTGSAASGAVPTTDGSGSAVEAVIYTVPASTAVRLDEVIISNSAAVAGTCALGIVPNGASIDGTHFVIPPSFTVQPGDSRVVTLHQGLDVADKLTALVSHNLLTITASGLVQAA